MSGRLDLSSVPVVDGRLAYLPSSVSGDGIGTGGMAAITADRSKASSLATVMLCDPPICIYSGSL